MKFSRFIIRFDLIWLVVALVANNFGVQEVVLAKTALTVPKDEYSSKKDVAENPLMPHDTSSPRDTLHSFITDAESVISEWQEHEKVMSPAAFQAYERSLSTLDYTSTPDSNSRLTRNRRLLLLQEILARIPLPPYSEIPGDEEVAQSRLKQWTIPGTGITIKKIEKGPRASEFLFSAGTVQRLHRYYALVKHLPYKAGATPGLYETFLNSKRSLLYLEGPVRNLLKPINTSSPRSTLIGFLDTVNRVYQLVMETNAALKTDTAKITLAEAREIEINARNLMTRVQGTLDLSQVPRTIREDIGIESVLQLKEIFDRMLLPDIESVPDMEMVAFEREHLSSKELGNRRPVRYQYPNSTIEIVEIMEGEHRGKFLFSAGTIRDLDELYNKVRNLPYRGDFSHVALEYSSPQTSKGFYEYYITTPGYLIHQVTLIGRIVERLPDWLKIVLGGQTLWQWIVLVFLVILAFLFLATIHYMLLHLPSGHPSAGRHWRRAFFFLVTTGTLILLYIILKEGVNVTGSVLYSLGVILETTVWLSISLVVFFISVTIAEFIVASPKIDSEGIQASYIRAVSGLLGILAAAAIFITGLTRVGVSLVPILTGVGIGGLAFALAARPTIENIIGSFMIFLDKPFQVGDRVKVMGQDGTIESIGLRSTKIRLLTGHLTAIPNEKIATVEVENIGRRRHIRRMFNITITCDTTPEKIARAIKILREILSVPKDIELGEADKNEETELAISEGAPPSLAADNADMERDSHPNWAINIKGFEPRVSFNDFNADSLNILVIYWFHPPDYWKYLDHATWINNQIVERFRAEGLDFAFPTQTLHLAGDDKRPLTVGQRADTNN